MIVAQLEPIRQPALTRVKGRAGGRTPGRPRMDGQVGRFPDHLPDQIMPLPPAHARAPALGRGGGGGVGRAGRAGARLGPH